MDEQESAWVQQALTGDKAAFNRLVEAYQRPVYNLAYRMLGNPQEAEDAAQETFLRAYARLRQYSPEHKFSTWILSITNHHCIDRLRKRRVQWISIDDNPVLGDLPEETPRPEQRALARERDAELQAMLAQLEPEYRTPLILRYWQDYSYEEIAAAMELSVPAVKSRLFRARKQMAELYQEREVAAPPASGARGVQRSPAQATPDRIPSMLRVALAGA